MNINITIPLSWLKKPQKIVSQIDVRILAAVALFFAVCATIYSANRDIIVAYGDAESHLDIAKRVVSSLTPGAAQLGGIWLPLPHLLMVPLVWLDPLWRSGLAGSIVSGVCFVVSAVFIYKIANLLTHNKVASIFAFLIFILNPNVLYLQSTPMTELTLILFFVISTYFFIVFIKDQTNVLALIFAAFFGFCATVSRYDGWFLVLFESASIIALYLPHKRKWREMEGKIILFSTLAFFGIALWMLWDYLILGDPFYFTNSQFSARTQQQSWLAKGELPAYHNILLSVAYYFVTGMSNTGVLIFLPAVFGLYFYIKDRFSISRLVIATILLVPFIFNVATLFLGQSVIFIPHLTPVGFEWRLFNVRYGVMVVPAAAIFLAYFYKKVPWFGKVVLIGFFVMQFGLYAIGYSKVISYADGVEGLSQSKRPDAESWMRKNYDYGLVIIDDYARTMSIIRSGVPMQNIVYVGTKPYWEQTFYQPEKTVRWVIMQKDDAVWKNFNDNPINLGRLYKYFEKTYTSPNIVIFRRNRVPAN